MNEFKWHPFPQEMPSECGTYIVTKQDVLPPKYNYVDKAFWDGRKWTVSVYDEMENGILKYSLVDIGRCIRAWMPSPKPYWDKLEEEKNDD